jgi:hypothetical protein
MGKKKQAVQMYAVVCIDMHVGFGPMDEPYAKTFMARMNAYSEAMAEQVDHPIHQCVYRVIPFWMQQWVNDDGPVETKARLN